jgi:hypothetical protein
MMEEDKGYDHQVPTYQEGKQKYTHNQALGSCCLNLLNVAPSLPPGSIAYNYSSLSTIL